jgi:hypothetical protein
MTEKKRAPIRVTHEEGVRAGAYSNAVRIQHTPMDFRMDFSQAFPDENRMHVVGRVYMSPMHAKMFMLALEDNVKKYERQFGAIALPKQPSEFPGETYPSMEKH